MSEKKLTVCGLQLAVPKLLWMRLVLLALTASCQLQTAYSQPGGYTSTDKSAIKKYESGVECMRMRKWDCAHSEFTKAAAADERFAEPRLMLAEMLEDQGKDVEAIARYREVITIAPGL